MACTNVFARAYTVDANGCGATHGSEPQVDGHSHVRTHTHGEIETERSVVATIGPLPTPISPRLLCFLFALSPDPLPPAHPRRICISVRPSICPLFLPSFLSSRSFDPSTPDLIFPTAARGIVILCRASPPRESSSTTRYHGMGWGGPRGGERSSRRKRKIE